MGSNEPPKTPMRAPPTRVAEVSTGTPRASVHALSAHPARCVRDDTPGRGYNGYHANDAALPRRSEAAPDLHAAARTARARLAFSQLATARLAHRHRAGPEPRLLRAGV